MSNLFAHIGFLGTRLAELAIVSAGFMAVLLLAARLARIDLLTAWAKRAIVGTLVEVRLMWRRPARVLACELKLCGQLAIYILLCTPMFAFGGLLYSLAGDWLANRYAWSPAVAGQDIAVRLTGPAGQAPPAVQVDPARAAVTAQALVSEAGLAWVRLQPVRNGIVDVALADGSGSFQVNVGEAAWPACRTQRVGKTLVQISYPRHEMWHSSNGYLFFALGACLAAGWPLGRWIGRGAANRETA